MWRHYKEDKIQVNRLFQVDAAIKHEKKFEGNVADDKRKSNKITKLYQTRIIFVYGEPEHCDLKFYEVSRMP